MAGVIERGVAVGCSYSDRQLDVKQTNARTCSGKQCSTIRYTVEALLYVQVHIFLRGHACNILQESLICLPLASFTPPFLTDLPKVLGSFGAVAFAHERCDITRFYPQPMLYIYDRRLHVATTDPTPVLIKSYKVLLDILTMSQLQDSRRSTLNRGSGPDVGEK
jgi:hypothetical protein